MSQKVKGMSVIVEHAYQEAKKGRMNLKASVRHMGNTFLNGITTENNYPENLEMQDQCDESMNDDQLTMK